MHRLSLARERGRERELLLTWCLRRVGLVRLTVAGCRGSDSTWNLDDASGYCDVVYRARLDSIRIDSLASAPLVGHHMDF